MWIIQISTLFLYILGYYYLLSNFKKDLNRATLKIVTTLLVAQSLSVLFIGLFRYVFNGKLHDYDVNFNMWDAQMCIIQFFNLISVLCCFVFLTKLLQIEF